jgi:hypothetical protein
MIQEIYFIIKQIAYLSGQKNIFFGGVGGAVGAVMGEEEHFCVVLFQECFQIFDIKSDTVCYTDGENGGGGQSARFIDAECA